MRGVLVGDAGVGVMALAEGEVAQGAPGGDAAGVEMEGLFQDGLGFGVVFSAGGDAPFEHQVADTLLVGVRGEGGQALLAQGVGVGVVLGLVGGQGVGVDLRAPAGERGARGGPQQHQQDGP